MENIETHPWEPFIPQDPTILIMGTFPPGNHRWSMDFYYPNRTNDFWYMMGLIYFNDPKALITPGTNSFNLQEIKNLLRREGIAMSDTALRVKRQKNNASDKFLEITEPRDIIELLKKMPRCRDIITTGEKATAIAAAQLNVAPPPMGGSVTSQSGITLWRCPSTSRAYPLPLDKKAEYYSIPLLKHNRTCDEQSI